MTGLNQGDKREKAKGFPTHRLKVDIEIIL